MKLTKWILALTVAPNLSFAFFCPTNFAQINLGATIPEVVATCGKPDKEEKKDIDALVPQEWTYFVNQPVENSALSTVEGTLKTQVMFDANGKAINISANGIGVGSTTLCGSMIQLGDTQETVKAACGQPAFVNKQQTGAAAMPGKTPQVTIFYYNSNPPTQLIFDPDGKLVERQ